ncbi:Rhs family protein [Lysobacter enzymogenes]|uniref:Rhs family protein n=1 Tax=Lysobacter enzymogenes TaxID=69 RepID=A0A0S2DPB7_LYSEN|nr:LysM peptidoglycan-binding domain-containing protein [Lysobacter enzymogenes]ALN60394.1 Rhs family protein [Lysobacter enzymogenes]QCW28336.1 LysM peptidoglycan-binding domain-containing protein [Lysobacter enzymogenes]
MVAIVTGNGLGLQASSALGLGGRGQVGTAGFGKSGEQVFVNAATGNLILRDRDQWLMGRGVDAELYRAYNSQAQLIGESWRAGVSKQVGGLTGTVNTAGSVVYRTDWDGSRIAYAWDATRSLYVAGEGAGTRDTLAWDAGNQRWTWTQGGSQLIERYDASKNGRVFESVDRDGNATSYVYNAAGALGEVRTANGEITYLDYDGSGRLSKIRTVTNNGSGAQTSTAVRYGYDGAGRLSTVTLDLSPDDNSIADGKVFTTTYGYDGSSGRIASIAQSDGAKVAFGYQLIDGQYRVVSIAQTSDIGVLRTTTLSYDTANRRTTITDPLGQDTILAYDAQGRLLQTSSPAVNGTRQTQFFGYDAAGQVATIRDGLGNEVKYTYDAAGNLIKQEDAVGTVVERTFGSDNQLLSETVSGPNTAAATTRYVYDAEQHLRFKISAEGRVTEWRYNAEGQAVSMREFAEARYADADRSEAALAAWAGAQSIGEQVDYGYDFRGNLTLETRYQTRLQNGDGVNAGVVSTRYVYDAQGRLLQRYKGEGTAQQDVEQFTYDGLGRLLTATAFDDSVTVTQYDDAQRRTIVSFANGLVRTSSYNRAGELIAVTESGNGGTVLSQVNFRYDSDGRLRMSEDALGARTHVLYDEAGRRVAEIDAAGALTEYVYDGNNQIVRTTRYAAPVDATALVGLVDGNGQPRQTATVGGQTVALTLANSGLRPAADAANDRSQWRFYDAAGRLSKTVGADGALVEYAYDAASRLLSTMAHYKRVDMTAFLAAPTAANAVSLGTVTDKSFDRPMRYFYDRDGLLRAQVDGDRYMTEIVYDGAGRKVREIAYNGQVQLTDDATVDQIRPSLDGTDRFHDYLYDQRGLLVAEVDGEGYVTRYDYDSAGNVSRRVRGLKLAQVAFPATTPVRFGGSFTARASAGADGVWPKVEVWVDGAKVQTVTLNSTSNTYNFFADAAVGGNHQIALVVVDASSERKVWIERASYAGVAFDAGLAAVWDAGGTGADSGLVSVRPAGTQQLEAPGALRWMVAPSNLLALTASAPGVLETTEYQYDLDGRLLKQTEYSASGTTLSTFRYDSQGRVVEQVRDDRKSLFRYDALGRVVAELSGEGAKALAALGSGATAAQVDALWQDRAVRYAYDAAGRLASVTDALDRATLYYYDAMGRATHVVNAAGEVTQKRYNAFGDVAQTVSYAKRLTSASLGQMHGGALSSAVQQAFALLDDAQASRVDLSYTIAGALSRSIDALGSYTDYRHTVFGQLEQTSQWTDRANRISNNEARTVFYYDRRGNRNARVDDVLNNGRTTTEIANAFGQVYFGTAYSLRQYLTSFDRNGRAVQQLDGGDAWAKMTYDAFGNVLSQTDRSGNTTQYSFTAFNREVRTTTAEGIQTVVKRNAHGQTVEVIDGRGNSTVYEYDLDGRLIRTTTPAGTVRNAYDQAGQVIESTDARGVRTTFAYDAAGRVLERVVDPDGLKIKTTYEYDAKGQLVRATDPLGMVTETRYDLGGQKIAVVVDAGEGKLNLTTAYDYDPLGRLLRVTEGAGTAAAKVTLNSYDKKGQLLSVTVDPDGLALKTQFAYWRDNVVARTDANGKVTRYVYDVNNRLTHTVDATGAVEIRAYDADGRLARTTAYAGRIDPASVSAYPTAAEIEQKLTAQGEDRVARYVYDRDGRLRYVLDSYNYVVESVYDNGGNVVRTVAYATAVGAAVAATVADVAAALAAQGASAHAADRATQFVYDAAGRMVFQLDANRYVTRNYYDGNGNLTGRVRHFWQYPANAGTGLSELTAWADLNENAASPPVSRQRWVYDAANRLAWEIDAGGYVVGNVYNAAGQRTRRMQYQEGTEYPYTRPDAYTDAGMRAWATRVTGGGVYTFASATTLWFYDAAGREVFSFDAEGYFIEKRYDARGNLERTIQYDKQWPTYTGAANTITDGETVAAIAARVAGGDGASALYRYDAAGRVRDRVDALGVTTRYEYDGLGQVTAEFQAWGTAAQVATRRRFDAAGRLLEQTRAADTALAAHTRYVYDAFGQAIATIDPRGVELAESDSAWALELRKSMDFTNETGAALRAADLSPAQRAALLDVYTSRAVYDRQGRLIQSIDALRGTVTRTYNAFGNAVSVQDALGNVGTFYFDANGNTTHQVDPEGFLTVTEYDYRGNAVAVRRYANRTSGAVAPGALPAIPAGAVSETRMNYNRLGQLISTTDAEGKGELYGYDQFGNRSLFTNKLGAKTSYFYDKLGRVVTEVYDVTVVDRYSGAPRSLSIQNRYDARGNLIRRAEAVQTAEERVTVFAYDALDRAISSTQTVATAQGSANANAVEKSFYDARGNLIEKIAANGARTAFYYDAADRLIGQVGANGLLTLNDYDKAGNLIRTRAFLTPVALPAGATVPAIPNDPTTGQASAAREQTFEYDANGRRTRALTLGAIFGDTNQQTRSYQLNIGQIEELWHYDLGGRLIEHTDGNRGVTRTWYDALGNKRLEIDAEGYGVAWVRDAEGNVLKETRYATRNPQAPVDGADLQAYIDAWPVATADSGQHRVTEYTYDRMGRRLSEARLGVEYGTVDSGNGRLTQATGSALTQYAYDAAGNLLRRTDANGSLFSWEYDKAGRNTAVILPGFVDYEGRSVSSRTEYTYNGLNQVVKEVRRGGGVEADQTSTYVYGSGGRLLSKTGAMGYTTQFGYDLAGNMLTMSYRRTDSGGGQRTETVQVAYDQDNRETSRVTVGSDGSRSVERRTRYNLFGDVTGRGTGASGWQEVADYDRAGRMYRSNMEGGVMRLYAYDRNGNATVKIESQTADLSGVDLETVRNMSLEDKASLFSTLTLYDKRNNAVQVIQAAMSAEGQRLGLKPTPINPTRPGEISVGVGGRIGAERQVPNLGAAHGVIQAQPALSNVKMGFEASGTLTFNNHYSVSAMDVTLKVSVPDLTSIFGQYDLQVEAFPAEGLGSTVTGYGIGTGPVTVHLDASHAGPGYFDRFLQANPYRIAASFRVLVVRKSDPGNPILISNYTTTPVDLGNGQIVYLENYEKHNWNFQPISGDKYFGLEYRAPDEEAANLPQGTQGGVILPAEAIQASNSAQVYVRPMGSNGPFQSRPISIVNDKAMVDTAGLAAGQSYEMLYVVENTDGQLVRRERYNFVAGPNLSVQRLEDNEAAYSAAFQANGLGNFVWTDAGLDMSALRTRDGAIPYTAIVEYRRKGSQDPWAGTANLPLQPPLGTAGSYRWDTAGMSGDYEVVLKLRDANNVVIETVTGDISVGAAPAVNLDFAKNAPVISLANLPPNASSLNLQVLDGNRVAAQAFNLSVVNGALSWNIPPELLAEVGDGVRSYRLLLSVTDRMVDPAQTYEISGTIEIGPRRRQEKPVLQLAGHLYSLTLDPKQAEAQVLVLHYRPDGNTAANFSEVVVLRGADGKFHWDSVTLDKGITYEYFYDAFRTLADARNPGAGLSLVRNTGYFWPDLDRPASEVRWEFGTIQPSANLIHRYQSYNAFGEIASETDGNGNTTNLSYNTLGKMVKKLDPLAEITYANGYVATVRNLVEYVYDRVGNIVAYYDANRNLTTQAWNYGSAKPTLVGEWHADGGARRYGFDVHGNQRVVTDEIGRTTSYRYDAGNRLISVTRPKAANETQALEETYQYDELDRRILHTVSSLGQDTTDFDIEGAVSRVVSAEGRVTRYSATWDAQANGGKGAWHKVTVLANNKSSTDLVDASGRRLSHVDFGDNAFVYDYNLAGLLAKAGNTVYEYYGNGLIKSQTDIVSGIRGYYEYDRNGNRTFEGFTTRGGTWAFQQSRAEYDQLNRLKKVIDPRYVIEYEYDAQGNRIHMLSTYNDPVSGVRSQQDYWYRYDNMNRFVVTMGTLGEKNEVRGTSVDDTRVQVNEGSGDGVLLAYDQANQRVMARYGRDGHTERYAYDIRGYLTDTTIDGTLRARRVNDLAGRVGDYYEYDASGALKSSTTRYWDNDSLLLQEHDNQANKGTITYRDADGTVTSTETYGEATTVTTTYTYRWFDSAKQSEIRVQASNDSVQGRWAPGFSLFEYDDLGRIKTARDVKGGRAFSYETDGEGRILQRDELLGVEERPDGSFSSGTQNRFHSYYFFDDRQVGNAGNDGIDRIDYAKELAQNQVKPGAQNDERHKRFAPVSGADFDQNYLPINSLYPTAAPGSYIVKAGDTLQTIAAALWGDSAMWYLLADANNLAPTQALIPNTVLTVPNKVANIHNNASTFKPYDAGSAMGNTSPTVPEPPPPPAAKKGCGGFVKVLAIVVAVVVSIYTAGVASGAGWGFVGAMSQGAAVMAGGMGFTAAAIGSAALGGAVGSIASQAVLIAGGVQDGFDWKGVGLSALGAAVTAGLGASGLADALPKALGTVGRSAVMGGVNSATTQALAVATGLQDRFDWTSVAISAVSAGAGEWVSGKISGYGVKQQWDARTTKYLSKYGSSFAAGTIDAAARGNLSGEVLLSVGLNALGSTIGAAISDSAIKERSFSERYPFTLASNTSGGDMPDVGSSPVGERGAITKVGTESTRIFDLDPVPVTATADGVGRWNSWIWNAYSNTWVGADSDGNEFADPRNVRISLPAKAPAELRWWDRPIYTVVNDAARVVLDTFTPGVTYLADHDEALEATTWGGTARGLAKAVGHAGIDALETAMPIWLRYDGLMGGPMTGTLHDSIPDYDDDERVGAAIFGVGSLAHRLTRGGVLKDAAWRVGDQALSNEGASQSPPVEILPETRSVRPSETYLEQQAQAEKAAAATPATGPFSHLRLSERHFYGDFGWRKKDNSIFLGPKAPAFEDLAEIQSGNAVKKGEKFYTSSGRVWGTHSGSNTLHPVSGDNVINVSRLEYDILIKYQNEGLPKALNTLQHQERSGAITPENSRRVQWVMGALEREKAGDIMIYRTQDLKF